jgi:hypothetical protein
MKGGETWTTMRRRQQGQECTPYGRTKVKESRGSAERLS